MSYGVDSFGVVSYGAPAAAGTPGAGSVPGATGTATGSGTGGDASAGAGNASVAAATGTGTGSGTGGVASSSNRPSVDRAFAVIGQSNASGRGTNNQTAPASGAYLYDNSGAFVALVDPWDAGPNTYSVLDDGIPAGAASGYGSCVPGLAQSYATAGKTTLWVPANKGTTNINGWQRNLATTSLYGAMKARIDAAGGVDTIIIHLGESDAMSGTAQATFTTKMNQLVTDLIADFGCQVYLHKIHNFSGYAAGTAAIRAAIDDCWTGTSGVKPGADLDGITTNVHFVTNTDISTVVSRTYAALENVAATGGSGSSSGSGTGGAAAGSADTGAGTGTSTGSGTGGDATGQAGTPAVAGSGTGTGTGSGTGGDAVGQSGTPAAAGGGTGTSTGTGTGGDALGQVAGAGNVAPGTGTCTGSGTGGTPAAQASASEPGGTGTGSGSGTGGSATGGALVNAVEPGGTGTGVGSGFGGTAGDIGDCRIALTVDRPTRIARAVTDLSVEFSRETIMSSRFVKGEVIRLHALITDDQEQPFDPAALVLRMRYDNGPELLLTYGADPEITRHTQGRFVADIPLAQGGVFHYRWETSGTADGAAEGSVSVLSGRFS